MTLLVSYSRTLCATSHPPDIAIIRTRFTPLSDPHCSSYTYSWLYAPFPRQQRKPTSSRHRRATRTTLLFSHNSSSISGAPVSPALFTREVRCTAETQSSIKEEIRHQSQRARSVTYLQSLSPSSSDTLLYEGLGIDSLPSFAFLPLRFSISEPQAHTSTPSNRPARSLLYHETAGRQARSKA